MHPNSLTEIANKYSTDKGTIGPSNRWNTHNYTDVYEAYLERFRKDTLNFLEIGLGVAGSNWRSDIVHGKNTGGASIKMWYEYFENSKIFGLDINECAYLDNDRIKTFVADQGDVKQLDDFYKKSGVVEFDCIIDDGSHRPDHQQISFNYFFKKLKPGGLYFIEDLLANGYGDDAKGRMSSSKVLNTRSIIKQYVKTGELLEPNALMDKEYLDEHIDFVRFHVPRVGMKYVLGRSLRHPIGRVWYHKQNTEKLCVIRKK
jgi:hypothetical protein